MSFCKMSFFSSQIIKAKQKENETLNQGQTQGCLTLKLVISSIRFHCVLYFILFLRLIFIFFLELISQGLKESLETDHLQCLHPSHEAHLPINTHT